MGGSSSGSVDQAQNDRLTGLETWKGTADSKLATFTNQSGKIDALQAQLNEEKAARVELEGQVALLKDKDVVVTVDMPKYALVTDISHRFITVTVYGNGDFPVLVYLYGEDLKAADVGDKWIVEAVEYREYDVVAVYLFGQELEQEYSSQETTGAIGNLPLPNAHTHEIDIPEYTLKNLGTLMVVVVEPDDDWINGDVLELDIQGIDDNNGWVDFATACVGVVN